MFLLVLALCAFAGPPSCSEWQTVFYSRTVTSASGAWSLHFEPHVTNGYRGADYRMTARQSDGSTRVVWEGRREFTLRDPIVDERGWVYGWAVVRGPIARPEEAGTLRVLALDEAGASRLDERTPQEVHGGGCSMPGPSGPFADRFTYSPRIAGLIRIPSDDRLIARVGGYSEEWWVYDPTAGKRTTAFSPFPDEPRKASTHVQFTLLVRETSLVLAHASCITWNSRSSTEEGFRESWALFDLEGKRVWSLDDIDNPHIADFDAYLAWERALTNRLTSSAPCRFSFFMSRTHETVVKRVRAGDPGEWFVEDAPLEPVK
jgi:hypothetical protein